LKGNKLKSIYYNYKERQTMSSLNRKLKALAVLLSFAAYMPLSMLPSLAAIDANTTPVLDASVNGGYVGVNGTNSEGQIKYDVNIAGGKGTVAQFDWQKFDVGSNVNVDWIFSNHHQTAINRVLNTGKASEIYGKLTSSCASGANCGYNGTGNVILINPNGILFGAGSSVNLNSFTASTMDISGMKNIKDAMANGGYYGAVKDPNFANNYISKNIVGGNHVGDITAKFKYGQTIAFTNKGSDIDQTGNGTIQLDGANFNVNKQIALLGDKIDINNSYVKTYTDGGAAGNYELPDASVVPEGMKPEDYRMTQSNIKLITSDGVNFVYDNQATVREDGANRPVINQNPAKVAGKDYGISITGDSTLWSGSIEAANKFDDTNVLINNSTIVGSKLWNGTTGAIGIGSAGDIIIADSRIETIEGFNDDSLNPAKGLNYGNIDIIADNNVDIDNSRIVTADSELNNTDGAKVGNLTIQAKTGGITIDKAKGSVNTQLANPSDGVDIVSGGNMIITAAKDTVINLDGESKIQATGNWAGVGNNGNKKRDLRIDGANLEINNAIVSADNMKIYAGTLNDNGTVATITGGGIKTNNTVLSAGNSLEIIGLDTTLDNTLLTYDNLKLYNDYMFQHELLHNVLINAGTTFNDRLANNGTKDAVVIETNGQLIVDNNKLQKKGFNETDPSMHQLGNQTKDIKLTSTQSQVSIRNFSDITTDGSITIDGHTNASVSTSKLNAGKDINMTGGTKVTIGDKLVTGYDDQGNVISQTRVGSELTAGNNINLYAKGTVKDPTDKNNTRGIVILNSKLNAGNNNTMIADNGNIVGNKLTAIAGNNNKIEAKNGGVGIQKSTYDKGSSLIAGNQSDITASDVVLVIDSQVKSGTGNNNITSKTNLIKVQGPTAVVESTGKDVVLTQAVTANLDTHYGYGAKIAGNNVTLNVTNDNADIKGSSLDQFEHKAQLTLNAGNKNILEKTTGDWTLSKVTLNSKENTIKAKAGNVTIANGDLTLGDKTNKTTIEGNNVKTTGANGVINTNSKKLIVNANKDIDIAFTGSNNKNAGLEINSNINTSTSNAALDGKNVTLNAKDNVMTLAKVKADTLTIVNPNTTKLQAAVDNKTDRNTDNINNSTMPTVTAENKAYIEVKKLAGWNMDTDIYDGENVPGFYQEHFDLTKVADDQEVSQRHFISFGNGNDFTLVYNRAAECESPDLPDVPVTPAPVISDIGLDESAYVRLPRHEEGVSAVAPVQNAITDPTANVISAAARLTVDEEAGTANASDDEDDLYGKF